MALDEALMDRARRSGECVLRVYSWAAPTLSLGRNQRARGVFDADRARELGVEMVRRLTGGRALLHHREITYSVAAPLLQDDSLRRWHVTINALLLRALRALGVPAETAPRAGRMAPPASAPCFELPAEGEIVVGGRKLAGSALVAANGAVLQHGSILIDDDQARIARLSSAPIAGVTPAATLREALGRAPSPGELATALFESVREREDADAKVLTLSEEIQRDVQSARARYASAEWMWRK